MESSSRQFGVLSSQPQLVLLRYCLIRRVVLVALAGLMLTAGCRGSLESEVVLCGTVDQDIAAPMLGAFYRSEGSKVSPKARFGVATTDRDAFVAELTGKTDGFVADVLWTDDIFLMADLSRRGLLESRQWQTESVIANGMIAKNQDWRAFAATARVLIVNTDKLTHPNEYPKSVDELTDSKWNQLCSLAMPTFGNPAIHAGVIGQMKGIDSAKQWFTDVSINAIVMKRDAEVAVAVGNGLLAWGLTSSSDAIAEKDASKPIAIVFPDQSPSNSGAILIPHAIAVMANSPNPRAAARLADYLVLPTTEDRLAMSDAAQIPLSRRATVRPRFLSGENIRWAEADFDKASLAFDQLEPWLTTQFSTDSNAK